MRSRTARIVAVATMVAATVGGSASLASATKGDEHKVMICHATASKTNPYVMITVDVASILGDSGHGNSGINEGDIIPAFEVAGYSYEGHNLHLLGANGCGLPTPPPNEEPPTFS